jgi:GT2 family glycosyltransferase
LFPAIESIDAEVWVVDNASTDGSVDYLKPKFITVNFIANTGNAGFGKANNQALQKCKGKYVLFLNPDTLLPEDCLKKCVAFMETNEQAGALGIRMIDGSGTFLPESKRSFPSPMTSFYKLTGLSRLFPSSRIFSRYALTYLNEHQNHEVDVLAGAFLLARKDVLFELKGFDEAFFMYGEDIDLSFRIQKLGYRNYYFSESAIIHFKGESAKKGSLNYVKMFYEAMSVFVKKHYTGTSARFYVFFIQIAIWLRAAISASGGFLAGRKKPLVRHLTKPGIRQKTIIVGTEDEYNEVVGLLVKAGLDVKVAGRVAVNGQDETSLGHIHNLPSLLNRIDVAEIIFCQGYLGYDAIIEIIQHLPAGISIRFHGKGTKSIVGSDSKNRSGDFVAAPIDQHRSPSV